MISESTCTCILTPHLQVISWTKKFLQARNPPPVNCCHWTLLTQNAFTHFPPVPSWIKTGFTWEIFQIASCCTSDVWSSHTHKSSQLQRITVPQTMKEIAIPGKYTGHQLYYCIQMYYKNCPRVWAVLGKKYNFHLCRCMGVLVTGSAHTRPAAGPRINMNRNCFMHMSGEEG